MTTQSSSYGFCPQCGAPGNLRERRPNGNDKCTNGHTYPSKDAVMPKEPPSAWDSMSDTEKVEWLATEVMGWKLVPEEVYAKRLKDSRMEDGPPLAKDEFVQGRLRWNPLTDWNHWRQVEEKVMVDEKMIHRYWDAVMKEFVAECPIPRLVFIFADLPTRARALYLAYQSL